MGFTAFVVDYGIFWLSRRQAQNAADAGALAGATARAFDETANPPSATGPAYQSALLTAQANKVWNRAPGVVVTWACPAFVPAGGRCVRVDAHQDGTNGSVTLPTYFAKIFNVTSQGVWATATGQVLIANASDCLKPWMIPDKFSGPDWPNGTFDPAKDVYVAPTATNPGTGYQVPNDVGSQVTLKEGSPSGTLSPSFYYEVDLNGGGGAAYETNIESCVDVTKAIGQTLVTLPGNRQGPTKTGVGALIAKDPGASWNFLSTPEKVQNSCAPGVCPDGLYHTISPRIVPIALFSPSQFMSLNRSSGRFNLTIVNILGFFVGSVDNKGAITGVLATNEGELISGTSTVGPQSAFNLIPALIQ